ncbi:MAG: hypothetical protein AAGC70_17550 [Pseudomonadota bacterium]
MLNHEQQNTWINHKFVEWQTLWHDYFQADPTLVDYERPERLPRDINSDFDLIFCFAQTTSATREKCFALFPNSTEMQCRFESYLSEPAPTLSASEARQLVERLPVLVRAANPTREACLDIAAVFNAQDPLPEEIHSADSIATLFETSLLDLVPVENMPAKAARLFLAEPLYASAGNYYELRDWVTGAMIDPRQDAVYELVYQLWRSQWQPRLGADGIMLFNRRFA